MEEEILETTWNLCKKFDSLGKRRIKMFLQHFISWELEMLFGIEIENDFRHEWMNEVDIFCAKYGYAS